MSSGPLRVLVFASTGVGVLLAVYLGAIAAIGLAASPEPGGVAVVLGNAVTSDRLPSPRLRARLDTAIDLYRSGIAPRILVSGGVERPAMLDEAAIMQAYLERAGVPSSAILADPHGDNTGATARDTEALLGTGTAVIVVTQWFHVPRTMMAMRRAGITHVSGAWPRYAEWRDAYSFLREAIAIPAYWLRPRGAAAANRP